MVIASAGGSRVASWLGSTAGPPKWPRAGQNQRLPAIRGRRDDAVKRSDPRLAVRVGQRYGCAHLLDGRRRVQLVALDKAPAELGRERPTDGRLASSGHAHHDNHHVRSIGQNAGIMGAGPTPGL